MIRASRFLVFLLFWVLEGVWAPFQVGGDLGVAARQPKTTTRHSKIVFFLIFGFILAPALDPWTSLWALGGSSGGLRGAKSTSPDTYLQVWWHHENACFPYIFVAFCGSRPPGKGLKVITERPFELTGTLRKQCGGMFIVFVF